MKKLSYEVLYITILYFIPKKNIIYGPPKDKFLAPPLPLCKMSEATSEPLYQPFAPLRIRALEGVKFYTLSRNGELTFID